MKVRPEAVVFVLSVTAVLQMAHSFDVCASCHSNATCDDKTDGSGKVCNCKYGFVGNGRTFCQDKDECQIGSVKICGQHTTCHNTYGSYFCTCLPGYSPSNNMATFIPNDGTNCVDIDECLIDAVCGEGAVCSNLRGSFQCYCQTGFRVQGGEQPFHPHRHNASCKVVDCGAPLLPEDAVLVSVSNNVFHGVATFTCDEGFLWRGGDNSSVCEASGHWTAPSMVCQEVDCGPPPARPHSYMLWDDLSNSGSHVLYHCDSGFERVETRDVFYCNATGQWDIPLVLCKEVVCGEPPLLPHTGRVWNSSSTPGSTVAYFCRPGFLYLMGSNVSICTIKGYWTVATILCKEISCGRPSLVPNSRMLWNGQTTFGSSIFYQCNFGYRIFGNKNVSLCLENGQWEKPAVVCQEIQCGKPLDKPFAEMLWDGAARVGSVVYYQCREGYFSRSLHNTSVCEHNGLWKDTALTCEETQCGPPLNVPNTHLGWDGSSRPGSVAWYTCVAGFFPDSQLSACSETGRWGQVSLMCQAQCGPVPPLERSEVVWHNRSVVVHRCESGFHSWTGSNTSICDSSTGLWKQATIACIEIKPPITTLRVLSQRCLQWKAEKYKEATEMYKILIVGSRDYQIQFLDKRTRVLSSKADVVEVCLNLLPATNYSITVTATTARFSAVVITNTSLTVPPAPVVHYREFDTPVPTLTLQRSQNTLDAISFYEIFVLPVDGLMVFDCSSPTSDQYGTQYITAQIDVNDVGREMTFTVGDGRFYKGSLNAPLQKGRDYYVILRAVSRWRNESKCSCVLWAKVKGSSYVLTVCALSAAAVVGSVALAFFIGYSYMGLFKKF